MLVHLLHNCDWYLLQQTISRMWFWSVVLLVSQKYTAQSVQMQYHKSLPPRHTHMRIMDASDCDINSWPMLRALLYCCHHDIIQSPIERERERCTRVTCGMMSHHFLNAYWGTRLAYLSQICTYMHTHAEPVWFGTFMATGMFVCLRLISSACLLGCNVKCTWKI